MRRRGGANEHAAGSMPHTWVALVASGIAAPIHGRSLTPSVGRREGLG